jgi:hypothetical protein
MSMVKKCMHANDVPESEYNKGVVERCAVQKYIIDWRIEARGDGDERNPGAAPRRGGAAATASETA